MVLPLVLLAMCTVAGAVVDEHKVIKLGVILPRKGRYPWALPLAGPGIEYAVESIRNSTELLQGYDIQLNYGDSKCSDTDGPLEAIDMYLNGKAHVFLGPACDYAVAPIARFSPHWNIPVITGGALVHAFSNKKEYKLLTRISGSYVKLGEFFRGIFKHFEWSRPGLLYNNNQGTNARFGRTDCFFIMEAVYLALRRGFIAVHGSDEEIWNKAFDEKQTGAEKPNFKDILGSPRDSVRLNARGKMYTYNHPQNSALFVLSTDRQAICRVEIPVKFAYE